MTKIEKGIIKQIYIQNFMTYNQVIIKPGRHLNVIIGPNGSGKSTVVCALVIGLGGSLKIIGRATTLKDYVKEGKTQALIEIQLKENTDSVTTITRIFDIDGKSTWKINGTVHNHKAIMEKISSYNIEMDNLCQFLPQDRVQDFSKMDSKQLLLSTEKSVGDGSLHEYHEQLIACRSKHRNIENDIANTRRLLDKKKERFDSIKEIVSGIKEKKIIKRRIMSLKQKKAWLLYDEKRTALLGLKNLKNVAEKQKKELQTKLQPIQGEINKIKSDIRILQTSVNDHNHKVTTNNVKMKQLLQKINEYRNLIKASEEDCTAKIQTEKNRDNEINLVERQKSKLENDLRNLMKQIGTESDLEEKQNAAASKMEKYRREIIELTQSIANWKLQENQIDREITGQQADLESMGIYAKRLNMLKQRSIDAYKGVLWLRENKDKFMGTIHEPMLLNINVKDASQAIYLENVISFRDLIAFVCEDKRDMNLLLKYLREQQNLQVNAVHSDPQKKVNMEPYIPLSSIQKYGFHSYLVSLMDAPPAIMKYLVPMYNLNNIPVGSNAIENHLDSIPHSISHYLSANTIYYVRTSKYTGERSTTFSSLIPTGLLSITLNESKIRKIKETIEICKEKKMKVAKLMDEAEKKVKVQNEELQKIRTSRSTYQQDLQQILVLKSRITMAEDKVKNLRKERYSVEEIKSRSKKQIQEMIRGQMQAYKGYNSALQELFKCITLNEEIRLALKLRQSCLLTKENESQELREQCARAEQQVEELRGELLILKKDAETLYNEALKTTDGINPQDSEFKKINKTFAKLPSTVAEINEQLNVAQAKVYCMSKNTDSEDVLQEYEKLEKDIGQCNDLLMNKTTELERLTNKIETMKEKWLPKLQQLVQQIDSNFSKHFEAMNCIGELSLITGANPMNFDQYGLQIKVKFRNTDELQELTRHFQSGGERAVTTAIYMIALQELARVPFRCVDEINQGMDAINEKRIFELLVKITGKPDSSQYFLLTPKLVPNLQYDETVTILTIFNGPSMISYTEFDVDEYFDHLEEACDETVDE